MGNEILIITQTTTHGETHSVGTLQTTNQDIRKANTHTKYKMGIKCNHTKPSHFKHIHYTTVKSDY